MMFSLLINGEEKGNMLLLICVNLRTHTQPAAVRIIRLGISSAVNQTHFTPRGSSSLRRKQEFRRKAGCRAGLAGWLQARALSLHPWRRFPHAAELPWVVTHTWMGLQAAQPSCSSGDTGPGPLPAEVTTQPVPLGLGNSHPRQ